MEKERGKLGSEGKTNVDIERKMKRRDVTRKKEGWQRGGETSAHPAASGLMFRFNIRLYNIVQKFLICVTMQFSRFCGSDINPSIYFRSN